jgi:hypothetical protein
MQTVNRTSLTRDSVSDLSTSLTTAAILLLMREGGLRVGEVLGLWLQDIEFHRNGVWVRRRRGLDNDALAKSMRDGEQRFIDLSPGLMALLDHLVLKHNFDTDHLFVVLKKTARDKRGRNTYVRPLNRHAVKAMFRHYSQKNEISLHAHMLRHAHATELIRADWDVSYVQKRLGHAHIHSTMTYVHLNDEDMEKKWQHFQEKRRDYSIDSGGLGVSTETDKGTVAILDPAPGCREPIPSVVELSRRAGYATTRQWFKALEDEGFRTQIEGLGVRAPRRQDEIFIPGPVALEDPDKVWSRDRVDLRRLYTDYPKHMNQSISSWFLPS